jgi:hypothetical protein
MEIAAFHPGLFGVTLPSLRQVSVHQGFGRIRRVMRAVGCRWEEDIDEAMAADNHKRQWGCFSTIVTDVSHQSAHVCARCSYVYEGPVSTVVADGTGVSVGAAARSIATNVAVPSAVRGSSHLCETRRVQSSGPVPGLAFTRGYRACP